MQPISDTIKVWVNVISLYGVIRVSIDLHIVYGENDLIAVQHDTFCCVYIGVYLSCIRFYFVRAFIANWSIDWALIPFWVWQFSAIGIRFDYCSHKSWSRCLCSTIIQIRKDYGVFVRDSIVKSWNLPLFPLPFFFLARKTDKMPKFYYTLLLFHSRPRNYFSAGKYSVWAYEP